MTNFFSNRTLRKTTIGNDQATTRLSTSINVGCAISDVAISKNHMLIIDIRGRLWSVGRNRNGQLGLCNRTDQSAPKLVPLPLNVKRVLSASTSSTHSVILCGKFHFKVLRISSYKKCIVYFRNEKRTGDAVRLWRSSDAEDSRIQYRLRCRQYNNPEHKEPFCLRHCNHVTSPDVLKIV